ncbi:hypothetical protein [Halorarius litoreus]|uniref:hypothetical protein n=1 Tax=Halorarius litoreus TaxID=2962676 RepID=UPI0020CCD041|nr:hypothetical protein [Halorarius litoreus]
MGRTNPTYRRYLQHQREGWSEFRRALRFESKQDFDAVLEYAERYADAAGYLNRADPETAMVLSMLVGLEAERRALAERLATLEEDVAADR